MGGNYKKICQKSFSLDFRVKHALSHVGQSDDWRYTSLYISAVECTGRQNVSTQTWFHILRDLSQAILCAVLLYT